MGHSGMSLRSARFRDLWKVVFSRSYENRYETLGFANLFCLGSGSIQFNSGMTAIVGGNGVGKSTLASALGELIESNLEEEYLSKRVQLSGSDLHATLHEGTSEKRRNATGGNPPPRSISGDDIASESWWLDPSYWGLHTRKQVISDPNFLDLLEPVTPALLSPQELQTISYVVGKTYDACSVYEVSDYADFVRFPYFKVSSDGVEYGSEHMGQGELSLMMTLWVLRDLRPNSILILEEPEAHVSPRSQHALMNVLAESVSKKGLWSIITTHSPSIIGMIPNEHIRLLTRSNGGVVINDRPHRHQIAAILGGSSGYTGIALVEDEIAKEFAISLLDDLNPDLSRQLEIVNAVGESQVSSALAALPKCGNWFRLIGIYDGDQRDKVDPSTHKWPHTFLPGTVDPAVLLVSALSPISGALVLSAELRRPEADVSAALNALLGQNPKDWLIELSRQLNAPRQELIRALTRVWLNVPENMTSALEFVGAVTTLYNA